MRPTEDLIGAGLLALVALACGHRQLLQVVSASTSAAGTAFRVLRPGEFTLMFLCVSVGIVCFGPPTYQPSISQTSDSVFITVVNDLDTHISKNWSTVWRAGWTITGVAALVPLALGYAADVCGRIRR